MAVLRNGCYHRIDGIMDEYVATGGPYYSDSYISHDGVFYDVDVPGDRVYEMGSSSHDIRHHLFYELEDLAQNMFVGGQSDSTDFPSNLGYGAFSVWIRGQIYKRPSLGSPH